MAVVAISKPRSPFGEVLHQALAEKDNMSVRQLSRLLAGISGDTEPDRLTEKRAEDKRRLLQRYITGDRSPSDETRDEIADALNMPRARFAVDREHDLRQRRLMNALAPLADVLLELAAEARDQ